MFSFPYRRVRTGWSDRFEPLGWGQKIERSAQSQHDDHAGDHGDPKTETI